MAVKSKVKTRKKVKAVVKRKPAVKKAAKKFSAKKSSPRARAPKRTVKVRAVRKAPPKLSAKTKTIRKAPPKLSAKIKAAVKKSSALSKASMLPIRRRLSERPVEVTRTINLSNQIRQPVKPATRKTHLSLGSTNSNPFNFMKAPRPEYAFEVGDTVEVFCDHEKGRERVRGWIKGIVVQVDNKMVAVQFRSNVFLTDGWMVPDRILWYPLNSEHIRPVATGRKPAVKKEVIPDY